MATFSATLPNNKPECDVNRGPLPFHLEGICTLLGCLRHKLEKWRNRHSGHLAP